MPLSATETWLTRVLCVSFVQNAGKWCAVALYLGGEAHEDVRAREAGRALRALAQEAWGELHGLLVEVDGGDAE